MPTRSRSRSTGSRAPARKPTKAATAKKAAERRTRAAVRARAKEYDRARVRAQIARAQFKAVRAEAEARRHTILTNNGRRAVKPVERTTTVTTPRGDKLKFRVPTGHSRPSAAHVGKQGAPVGCYVSYVPPRGRSRVTHYLAVRKTRGGSYFYWDRTSPVGGTTVACRVPGQQGRFQSRSRSRSRR